MKLFANITRGLKAFARELTGGEALSLRQGGVPLWGESTPALGISTVFACVKLISESVASLPVRILRERDGLFVHQSGTRLDYLLNVQPEPARSSFDFWRAVATEVLLDGNAYIVPVYNPVLMGVDRLALCTRGTVRHDTANDIYTVHDDAMGIAGTFTEADIIHIKGPASATDPKRGLSVLAYARQTLGISSAAMREMRTRFANGGTHRGILSGKLMGRGMGAFDPDEVSKMTARISASLNSGGIEYIPGEFDYKQLSLSAVDMQFLESIKFNVIEICRFFSVHPSFVFADTSNNYKSAENSTAAFLNTALNPLLRNIEGELLRKLVPETLAPRRRFEFDRWALYASNLVSRLDFQTKALAIGARTVNEIRQQDNLPPVAGGDEPMVSANLRTLNQTSKK